MLGWLATELKALTEPDETARFALDLSNQQVTLVERAGGGERIRGSVSQDDPDFNGGLAELRRIVARRRGGKAPVDLLLPPELTLFRIETFPAEARRNVRDEAWWRLDMLTPYRPEELCYDVAELGVEPTTGFIDVHIAVAPREIVEEAVNYARAWGFEPQRVSSRDRAYGFPRGPLFHQAASRLSETRTLRTAAFGMLAATLALGVIGSARAVSERHAIAEAAVARQSETDDTLQKALAMRQRTLSLADRAMLPAARREGERMVVDWMNALAAALPPETVAERIIISGGALRIEGLADNAEAVLAALDTAEEFSDVRYAAPVADSGGRPAHRFAIEARLTPKPVEQGAKQGDRREEPS